MRTYKMTLTYNFVSFFNQIFTHTHTHTCERYVDKKEATWGTQQQQARSYDLFMFGCKQTVSYMYSTISLSFSLPLSLFLYLSCAPLLAYVRLGEAAASLPPQRKFTTFERLPAAAAVAAAAAATANSSCITQVRNEPQSFLTNKVHTPFTLWTRIFGRVYGTGGVAFLKLVRYYKETTMRRY